MDYNETKTAYSNLFAVHTSVNVVQELAKEDLFFFLVYVLGRRDSDNKWCYDRCREVQAKPNGMLDLWSREHYKSTIITMAMTIWDIIHDPELTVCIFSFTRPIAKAFLRQIKQELEQNIRLLDLYPDVFYREPKKESPKWSEDEGIVVKRKGNPKEATIEAWGMVDGQPTSKHFRLRVYDDIVTRESVTTPEMIRKVTDSWSVSLNLGTVDGDVRYVGTRWHFNDTYSEIIRRGAAQLRLYTPTKDGTKTGDCHLWTRDILVKKIREMGEYVASCQLFQNPVQDEKQGFREQWLVYWEAKFYNNLNIYIIVDPASEKKTTSDYTVMMVIGAGEDGNYYILDMIRDRLSLSERANTLFSLHREYKPIAVGYEKYGMQADIPYMQEVMARDNYRFAIIELGGNVPKTDRIKSLVPYFEQGRIYLPSRCVHTNYTGVMGDNTKIFVNEEYLTFPYCQHDDMLDCLARIVDNKLNICNPNKSVVYYQSTNNEKWIWEEED